MLDKETTREVETLIENYMAKSQFMYSKIPSHTHNGIDTVKLNPRDFLGFPIISAVPTDSALEGTIRIYSSGGTYRLYVRVNNLWKYTALT